MSGLVKQLLLDYNILPIEKKIDMIQSIEILYKARVFTKRDIYILHEYLSGYTSIEIAERNTLLTQYVEETLIRMLRAIEITSGYTDIKFVASIVKKQQPHKLQNLIKYLQDYGVIFTSHEPAVLII